MDPRYLVGAVTECDYRREDSPRTDVNIRELLKEIFVNKIEVDSWTCGH